MSNLKGSQKGFGLLGTLVLLGTVGLIGIIGIFVWQSAQDKQEKQDTGNQSNNSGSNANTPSWLANEYISKSGGFTMKYPQSWITQGYKAGQKVTPLDGNEDQLIFQVANDDTKLNNFKGTLRVTDEPPGDERWPLYPNGTIVKTLKNNIGLWRDNQTQILEKGKEQNNCPSLRIANDEAFGYKLKNGKYVSFIGSFCTVPSSKTSYSYGQQVASEEFMFVTAMLESIKEQ